MTAAQDDNAAHGLACLIEAARAEHASGKPRVPIIFQTSLKVASLARQGIIDVEVARAACNDLADELHPIHGRNRARTTVRRAFRVKGMGE